MSKIILVTGASSGIGRACAEHLASRGLHVLAGVRRDEDAQAVRAEHVEPLLLDVTDPDGPARALAAARAAGGLYGLVNNAGITVQGPVELVPPGDWRRQFEVNVVGAVAMIQALLPLLRASRGRVVNMSSIGGRMALPFLGPYNASKFALEGLSDSLRMELSPQAVHVAVVEPGSIATAIWEKGERAAQDQINGMEPEARHLYGQRIDGMIRVTRQTAARAAPPSKVARAVEHALTARRPRTRYVVGADARGQAALRALLPDRALDALVGRLTRG